MQGSNVKYGAHGWVTLTAGIKVGVLPLGSWDTSVVDLSHDLFSLDLMPGCWTLALSPESVLGARNKLLCTSAQGLSTQDSVSSLGLFRWCCACLWPQCLSWPEPALAPCLLTVGSVARTAVCVCVDIAHCDSPPPQPHPRRFRLCRARPSSLSGSVCLGFSA